MNTRHLKARTNTVAGTSIHGMKRNPLFAVIVGSLALLAGGNALAQAAPAVPAAPAEATAAEGEAKTLDAVIVTANKRSENIRKVASSISVVSGDQLENTGATQLSDYADYIPGFQVTTNGTPGKTQVSMRGIAPLSSGSTVGTYIDETPVGSSGIYQAATILALDMLPYDIDRIEVLRGPQGTLYGAGSMGGLLKYVTREPDLYESEIRVGGGISSPVGTEGLGHNERIGFNLPISEGRLGLRASFARNAIPGYIDNSVNGEEDINDGIQTSARAALLWRSDDVDFSVSALRQTIDSDNNAIMALDPVTGDPMTGDLENAVYVDEPFEKDISYFAATLDWDLGWADFTSATGYSDTDTSNRVDATIAYGEFTNLGLGLPAPGSSFFDNTLALQKFTQEFRLTSKAGSTFEWMLGGFYSDEEGDNHQYIELNQIDGSPLPPPYNAIAGVLAELELPTSFQETAIFANGTWHITDRFSLGAGVRYSENSQDFSQNVTDGLLLPLQESPNSSDEDVFTWSLTPSFDVNDDVLLYGKIATGYQPGGPNVLLPGIPPQVDSSMLISYEIGLKSQFADDRVIIDVAAFHIDWEDIQVITSFAGNNGLANGGEATSQGIELSSQFRPIDNLTLGLNAAYIDASVAEDFPTVYIPSGPYVVELNTGLGGDQLPYVPEWSWSATFDYAFAVGADWEGHVGGGFRWVDDRVGGTTERQVITDPSTTPPTPLLELVTAPVEIDSYQSLDLYASLANDRWTFRAYMKNVSDERGFSSIGRNSSALTGTLVSLAAAPIQPRTFGLEMDFRF